MQMVLLTSCVLWLLTLKVCSGFSTPGLVESTNGMTPHPRSSTRPSSGSGKTMSSGVRCCRARGLLMNAPYALLTRASFARQTDSSGSAQSRTRT